MTLIVAAGNSEQVIISADTRLSWNGELIDDETCKLCHLVFFDGTILCAFTGLVGFGTVKIPNFMQSTLKEAAKPWTKAFEALGSLEKALTALFQSQEIAHIRTVDRGLTIVFGGYIDNKLMLAQISNCKDIDGRTLPVEDRFTLTTWTHPTTDLEWAFVQGATDFVKDGAREELYQLAQSRKPADAIAGKCHATILEVAERAKSVGKNVLTGTLVRGRPVSTWYSPAGGQDKILLADMFSALNNYDGALAVSKIVLNVSEPFTQRTSKRGKGGKHHPRRFRGVPH